MDEDERISQPKPSAPMPKLQLTPEHRQQIAEFSGMYLPPLAEAVDFSEDELVGRLYALLYASKEEGTKISRKHAKAIEKIAIAAGGGHIVVERIRHALAREKPQPGTISQAYARLYQPSEAMGSAEKMAGAVRIEIDGSHLGEAAVKALSEKYSKFVNDEVDVLRAMGYKNPASTGEIVELWKEVSSIIWSNFSQAEHLNNQQSSLAQSMISGILNCDTSCYPAADIMAQFGVQSTQLFVTTGLPESGHVILRCQLAINPESVFVETRAEYPGYYGGMELTFGTYSSLAKVAESYPVIYGEIGFADAGESDHWRSRAHLRSAFDEELKREIEKSPNSAANYWNYVIRGCVSLARGNAELAAGDFSKAVSLAPRMPDAYMWLAQAILNTDKHGKYKGKNYMKSKDDATDVLKAGIKKNGKSAALYEKLGNLLEDYDAKIEAYSRAIGLAPTAGLYRARAKAFEDKGFWGIKEEGGGKEAALAANASGAKAGIHKARAALYAEAILDLEKAAGLEPWHAGTYETLAKNYDGKAYHEIEASGGYGNSRTQASLEIEAAAEKAVVAMWEGALAADPPNARIRIAYAQWVRERHPGEGALGGKSPKQKAVELLDEALRLAPTSANYFEAARILENLGYSTNADYPAKKIFDMYAKAIKAGPNNVEAYYWFSVFLNRVYEISINNIGPLPAEVSQVIHSIPPNKGVGDYIFDMLEEGARKNPSSSRLYERIARAYQTEGMESRAVAPMAEAIRIMESTANLDSTNDSSFNLKMYQSYSYLAGLQSFNQDLKGAKASIEKAEKYEKRWREIEDDARRRSGRS
ncbi:MAG: hypothetical protein WC717_01840 [Candidatus Micrarchaeia archaeon]|jgi:tetratricopeptide (TPR) repeat protein